MPYDPALYPHIRETNRATLGFGGEVVMATDCPAGHGRCAPAEGSDCADFMGHLHKGRSAYVGQTTPICCAELLRREMAAGQKEQAHG